jgi:transposase InsO family protein
VIRWLLLVFAGALKPRARLIAENVCLRQQLVVLKRRQKRPSLRDADRRFWILASRWFGRWREMLLVVQPETVLRWHRKGWKAYWSWRSRRRLGGRQRIPLELRELIRRMARDNPLWGQQRIQGELAELGFTVCARTVAKYMRRPWSGQPSPGWRQFLAQHADEIWACDLFTVQTIWFRTLYVFFVIHHGSRELIHARVKANPTADWLAQQITQACDVDREPPRYLIHDRDGCFGDAFNRRARSLGITQIRTPVKAPTANAIAERWIRTARSECLDHRLVLGHQHLQRLIDKYVACYNEWRPHRSLEQRAPLPRRRSPPEPGGRIVADPIGGGLHHVYRFAA